MIFIVLFFKNFKFRLLSIIQIVYGISQVFHIFKDDVYTQNISV
jgi:hypothetical protein